MEPEIQYRFELYKYLDAISDIEGTIASYRAALEDAIEDLQMELESLGDPTRDTKDSES